MLSLFFSSPLYVSVCLSLHLSICLFVPLFLLCFISLYIYLSVCLLSIFVYLSQPISLPFFISLFVFLSVSTCLSVFLSIFLSLSLSPFWSLCLSFCLMSTCQYVSHCVIFSKPFLYIPKINLRFTPLTSDLSRGQGRSPERYSSPLQDQRPRLPRFQDFPFTAPLYQDDLFLLS